jgi:alpha-L-fucosidase
LLNLALKADGSMQDKEIAYLRDMAAWMNVVSEGIHASRPWLIYGELEAGQSLDFVSKDESKGKVYQDPEKIPMGRYKLHPGGIRYTRSKDGRVIYATRLAWPEEPFVLTSFAADGIGKDVEIKSVSLLGCSAEVQWERTANGLVVNPPVEPVFEDREWPVMFRLELY